MARESIETTGLVVTKFALEPDPKAECVGHCAMHIVPRKQSEIREGETRQSVVDSLRADALRFGRGRSEEAWEVAALLRQYADRVEQIDETVGELLARTGLEEGESLEIRYPTVAEDQDRAVAAIAAVITADPADRLLLAEAEPAALTDEALHTQIANLEAVRDEATAPEDDLSDAGYARLFDLQAERDRRNYSGPWEAASGCSEAGAAPATNPAARSALQDAGRGHLVR